MLRKKKKMLCSRCLFFFLRRHSLRLKKVTSLLYFDKVQSLRFAFFASPVKVKSRQKKKKCKCCITKYYTVFLSTTEKKKKSILSNGA